ncbi:MAG TPA: energy transducer TonB [Candidatus Acidoferrum sp.]|jgi:TonB family protein
MNGRNKIRMIAAAVVGAFALLSASLTAATEHEPTVVVEPVTPGDPTVPRVSAERAGTLSTGEGLTLRLVADLGSVKIVALAPGSAPEVRYKVHLETDAPAAIAQHLLEQYSLKTKAGANGVEINGALPKISGHSEAAGAQFWIQFEIAVPQSYSVVVDTQAGDIETKDIGGTAMLSTQGGNIRTGSIGGGAASRGGLHAVVMGHLTAKLLTEGGHIQVQDVSGDLNAFTAGGHIVVGNIGGDASLHSGGGHIRAGSIDGRADLQTDGGNITVGKASNFVAVHTGGGQIDFGEVRGSVRAQTGGGGIRIMYVSGPMQVQSSAGSICLTRVAGTVQAATVGGSIRAWISPDGPSSNGAVHLAGASQFTSANGDIIVFLPRNLAADIDAIVESGGAKRIQADPALELNYKTMVGDGALHAMATLNGGGAPLKIRTTGGTIKLQFLDSETGLREALIRDQQQRLTERLNGIPVINATFASAEKPAAAEEARTPEAKADWVDGWVDKFDILFYGGIREDWETFQKQLINSPRPVYPVIARKAGVQGMVKLQIRATKDGRVTVEKLIEGEPALADAAIASVKQWRIKPVTVNGQPVGVISTVTFNFQLH